MLNAQAVKKNKIINYTGTVILQNERVNIHYKMNSAQHSTFENEVELKIMKTCYFQFIYIKNKIFS